MEDRELNFARELLQGRSAAEVHDDEVLSGAERLLSGWMAGTLKMERPKLYDHYALPLAALLRRVMVLEARVAELEGQQDAGENSGQD
ncbi:hypothetical protein GCM10022631_21020 [Deinococcus rubellus]|uniref:Uncharacterized protein n=1 Tax=Deinococcus rubellus TaxID=1889240 RepID=A0ABY5YJF3_9DEIO|nr:hypothetical protein [Deinococcus rubellus]UWX64477.1 hypothetical protein N0D28_02060 [Deinococcus rubellus]